MAKRQWLARRTMCLALFASRFAAATATRGRRLPGNELPCVKRLSKRPQQLLQPRMRHSNADIDVPTFVDAILNPLKWLGCQPSDCIVKRTQLVGEVTVRSLEVLYRLPQQSVLAALFISFSAHLAKGDILLAHRDSRTVLIVEESGGMLPTRLKLLLQVCLGFDCALGVLELLRQAEILAGDRLSPLPIARAAHLVRQSWRGLQTAQSPGTVFG